MDPSAVPSVNTIEPVAFEEWCSFLELTRRDRRDDSWLRGGLASVGETCPCGDRLSDMADLPK